MNQNAKTIDAAIMKLYIRNLEYYDKSLRNNPYQRDMAYRNAVRTYASQSGAVLHGDIHTFNRCVLTLPGGKQYKIINKQVLEAFQY